MTPSHEPSELYAPGHRPRTVGPVSEEQQPEQLNLNMQISQDMWGGVWANWAAVSHSQYEFTIDFARVDFANAVGGETVQGLVVSRINLSPLMVTQLLSALQDNWQKYAEKALPKEVHGDGHPDDAQD